MHAIVRHLRHSLAAVLAGALLAFADPLGATGDAGGTRSPTDRLYRTLFDLSPEIAAQRLASARAPDRFEREMTDFHTRVRDAYLRRAERFSDRIRVIDGSRSLAFFNLTRIVFYELFPRTHRTGRHHHNVILLMQRG